MAQYKRAWSHAIYDSICKQMKWGRTHYICTATIKHVHDFRFEFPMCIKDNSEWVSIHITVQKHTQKLLCSLKNHLIKKLIGDPYIYYCTGMKHRRNKSRSRLDVIYWFWGENKMFSKLRPDTSFLYLHYLHVVEELLAVGIQKIIWMGWLLKTALAYCRNSLQYANFGANMYCH